MQTAHSVQCPAEDGQVMKLQVVASDAFNDFNMDFNSGVLKSVATIVASSSPFVSHIKKVPFVLDDLQL